MTVLWLPSVRSALLVATHRWPLRRSRGIWYGRGRLIHLLCFCVCFCVYVCLIALFILAFRRGSSRPAWPLVFRRGCLADGFDIVVSDSAPVLAADRTFTVGPAIRLVAGIVHPHFAVGPGTGVAARKHLIWESAVSDVDSLLCLSDSYLVADGTLYDLVWISGFEILL
jgi:hypothetical protein